jgi:hypothetical protein
MLVLSDVTADGDRAGIASTFAENNLGLFFKPAG